MLDRLYATLPKGALATERFEIPAPEAYIQGNRTIVKNFSQIVKTLRRDEKHMMKFITKESATSANIEGQRLILNSKFSQRQVSEMISNYAKQYVLCQECGKPDTRIMDHQGVKMLKCEACGALSPLKKVV